MVGDPSYIPVGGHFQLKLHSITPVILPPRCARARDPRGTHASTRAEAGVPPLHGDAQSRHVDRNQRNRSDSLLVSNAAIFSSPIKRAGQTGSIHVHRPHKRAPENGHLARETKRLGTAEPIAFDPFSESPYCSWLSQDPSSSTSTQQFRRDADNVRGFREWITTKFPKVVTAFKALDMLHDRPPPSSAIATPTETCATATTRDPGAQQPEASDSEDEFVEVLESKSDAQLNDRRRLLLQLRAAQQQAWGVLLESARLLSIPPGDTFVTQDVTPAREVFFLLSGQCQLLFQPKFLDLVVQARNELKSNHASRKGGSPKHSKRAQADHGPKQQAGRDPVDLQSSLDALLAMRRLSLSTLTEAEASEAMAHAVNSLRTLSCGDHFGLEACVFRFPHHSVSAVSHGALHRNAIGVATQACLYVLVVPFRALETMRSLIRATRTLSSAAVTRAARSPAPEEESLFAPRRRAHVKRSIQEARPSPTNHVADAFPGCAFRDEDVEFLRHTFLLQSIQLKRLQFLATQVRLIQVPKHEYLFTTGQEVLVYLVRSGQLRVFSPEQVRIHTGDEDDDRALRDAVGGASNSGGGVTTVETRHVELEILQTHDTIGLMEASLLQPTFSNYCLATSADVWVYAIPPVALFTVLAHEPTASHQVVENLLCHHSWYKARKFTALNHHNKQTEFRLSLGAQHKSPIPCSRCGWSGHSSTSSLCVRAASPKSAFIEHLMGKGEQDPRVPTAPPVTHNPSLRTRMERVSQLRLAQAHGSGSVAAVPVTGDGDPDPACTGMPCTGPRTGSMVVGRGGGAIPTSGSMLPGLADLAMLLRGSQPMEDDQNTEAAPAPKSEVARALERLDAALEVGELMPPLMSPSRSPRPASQQMQRRRPGESNEGQRGSVYNLRDEALRVVARIGTATTVAPGGARALTRRKAIDDR